MATALAAIAAKPNLQRLGGMPVLLYDPRTFEGVSSLRRLRSSKITFECTWSIRLANAVPPEEKR